MILIMERKVLNRVMSYFSIASVVLLVILFLLLEIKDRDPGNSMILLLVISIIVAFIGIIAGMISVGNNQIQSRYMKILRIITFVFIGFLFILFVLSIIFLFGIYKLESMLSSLTDYSLFFWFAFLVGVIASSVYLATIFLGHNLSKLDKLQILTNASVIGGFFLIISFMTVLEVPVFIFLNPFFRILDCLMDIGLHVSSDSMIYVALLLLVLMIASIVYIIMKSDLSGKGKYFRYIVLGLIGAWLVFLAIQVVFLFLVLCESVFKSYFLSGIIYMRFFKIFLYLGHSFFIPIINILLTVVVLYVLSCRDIRNKLDKIASVIIICCVLLLFWAEAGCYYFTPNLFIPAAFPIASLKALPRQIPISSTE